MNFYSKRQIKIFKNSSVSQLLSLSCGAFFPFFFSFFLVVLVFCLSISLFHFALFLFFFLERLFFVISSSFFSVVFFQEVRELRPLKVQILFSLFNKEVVWNTYCHVSTGNVFAWNGLLLEMNIVAFDQNM